MKERTILLIEAIAAAGNEATGRDLVAATGLPQATVYRQVAELLAVGWVEKSGHGLRLGRRLLQLVLAGQEIAQLKSASAASLASLADAAGETAFVARYINNRVEIFDCLLPAHAGKASVLPPMGDRPLHACSAAKSIMAHLPKADLDAILTDSFVQFTGNTLTTKQALLKELSDVRDAGYAHCIGEEDQDLASFAAPVPVLKDIVSFSIGIIGPRGRMSQRSTSETVEALQQAALMMQQALVSPVRFQTSAPVS